MFPIVSSQCNDLVFIEKTMREASYQGPAEVVYGEERGLP